ncbi:ATP-binding protein [Streptomyces sp. LP11]|uniref:ATP-binding protein n=1 Tax=Streptomyces pyxinicus TaxID=2970331 RepID=A0ABT2B412_9ACTN|nr:ATP-binding protein [Streptomyces sp. LP11]MCS0602805.1 ATP-binding protein [Streptomyces sp. LP11]
MATLSHVNERISTHRDTEREFFVPLSATRRGARLARLLATEQLRSWGLPLDPARLIVAELAANAALHGKVRGRGFRVTLSNIDARVLRIEVTDPRGDRLPVKGAAADGVGESGYGLLLVEQLADRWGVREGPVPCKTVWAELDLAVTGDQAAEPVTSQAASIIPKISSTAASGSSASRARE